jgi:hypothetical protein
VVLAAGLEDDMTQEMLQPLGQRGAFEAPKKDEKDMTEQEKKIAAVEKQKVAQFSMKPDAESDAKSQNDDLDEL